MAKMIVKLRNDGTSAFSTNRRKVVIKQAAPKVANTINDIADKVNLAKSIDISSMI